MNDKENQKKYQEFVLEEAKWLDEIVRAYIPKWIQWVVEKNSKNIIGRIGHFIIDYFYIGKILGIKITRNQDTEIPGGKGFRQKIDHGYKILAVRTTISKRGTEVAQKRFPLNITFKN